MQKRIKPVSPQLLLRQPIQLRRGTFVPRADKTHSSDKVNPPLQFFHNGSTSTLATEEIKENRGVRHTKAIYDSAIKERHPSIVCSRQKGGHRVRGWPKEVLV